jgi:hypothetical protein
LSFFAIAAAAAILRVNACSPRAIETTDKRIETALQEADSVVIARIISVKHSPRPGNRSGEFVIEDAALDVIDVIKGPHKIGDTIQVRSTIGPGLCGRSVRNDPPWIFQASDQQDTPDRPASISDTWLVYGQGEQPYDLDSWYSAPMNLTGKIQVEILHRLARETIH